MSRFKKVLYLLLGKIYYDNIANKGIIFITMKAKLNIKTDENGNVRMEYAGLKKQKSVDPIYKNAVVHSDRRKRSYSEVDESVMQFKFSI